MIVNEAQGLATIRSCRHGTSNDHDVKGRRVEEVVRWFQSRPQAELDGVEVVVLDMSKSFYSAIGQVFGDQVEVIDRFHVVQQAVGALDGVLRSVQKQLDRQEANELKKLRKRWLKLPNQLEVDELIALVLAPTLPTARSDGLGAGTCASGCAKYRPTARAAFETHERARASAGRRSRRRGTLSVVEPLARYMLHRYTTG